MPKLTHHRRCGEIRADKLRRGTIIVVIGGKEANLFDKVKADQEDDLMPILFNQD